VMYTNTHAEPTVAYSNTHSTKSVVSFQALFLYILYFPYDTYINKIFILRMLGIFLSWL
jgi:hypothetical protein